MRGDEILMMKGGVSIGFLHKMGKLKVGILFGEFGDSSFRTTFITKSLVCGVAVY